MIAFCEECGEKNTLPPSAVTEGRAVFQCQRCRYANAFPVNVRETPSPGHTERFLAAALSCPGIIGAFLYHVEKKVLGADMPPGLTPEDINTLGDGLVSGYEDGLCACPDMDGMTAVISDKHFFVHRITPELYTVMVTAGQPLPAGFLQQVPELLKGR